MSLADDPYYQARSRALHDRKTAKEPTTVMNTLRQLWRRFCVWRLASPRK